MITDENGIVEEVNDSFCQITGYTKDEMIGQNASILKSGRHDDDFIKLCG
jgi:PAS domain S-box-containing protein